MAEMLSHVARLERALLSIEDRMSKLIGIAKVKRFVNDPYSPIVWVLPEYYWETPTEEQRRLQLSLLQDYTAWFESFQMLFLDAPPDVKQEIEHANKTAKSWINLESDWGTGVRPTVEENKARFKETISPFYRLLRIANDPERSELILLPETSALIESSQMADYSRVAGRPNFMIILLPTVLEELEKVKATARDNEKRNKADTALRTIKGLRNQGPLLQGVTVAKTIVVKTVAEEPRFDKTLHWLDPSVKDDRIIASALEIQRKNPSATVVLVTADMNLQNKAEMANLPFEEPPI